MTTARGRRHARGMSAVETLLALPVLLLVAGGALQFGLLMQARHALSHAVHEAARAGTVAHADPAAIEAGLARGLMPWLYGADDLLAFEANLVRARAHVVAERGLGRLRLVVQSPTAASFDDWSAPARDPAGATIDGVREIPNDDLARRALRAVPASGVAGRRNGQPIGLASGQTLSDANLLRLRLELSVPMSVPVVGQLVAVSLRVWHGCAAPAARRLGLVDVGPPAAGPVLRPEMCAMLGDGLRPRLPITVGATLRMQSPARFAGAGGERAPVGAVSVSTGDSGGPPGGSPDATGRGDGRIGPFGAGPAGARSDGAISRAPDAPAVTRPRAGGDPPTDDPAFCRRGDS